VRSVGLGLMTVGRLQAAFPICRRSREMATEANDWLNASKAYQLIAELQIHLGRFGDAEQTARGARGSAARLGADEEGLEEQACSLAYEAWAAHLLGDLDNADSLFAQAEEIRPVSSPDEAELTDLWGIYYAEHLAVTGRAADAIERLNNNMRISEESLPEVVSQCHRVLGDIELEAHGPSSTLAEAHYSEAVKIATAISHRAILIEALLGRGRLSAVRGDLQQAQADLFKALDLAHASGYAMYEADAHWTLALAYLTAEEFEFGRVAAQRGAGASEVIGYHWGIERTNEILSRIPAQV
jgi:tetratricopeptide (TPR) repeat protein